MELDAIAKPEDTVFVRLRSYSGERGDAVMGRACQSVAHRAATCDLDRVGCGAGRLYAHYVSILGFVSVIRTLHIYFDANANRLLQGCVFNVSGQSFRTAHARRRNLFCF